MVTLNELFTNGEILPCKVMEYDSVGNYRSIKLSLNPSDVNEYLTAASIRNGMVSVVLTLKAPRKKMHLKMLSA